MRTAKDEHALDNAKKEMREAEGEIIDAAYDVEAYPQSTAAMDWLTNAVRRHQVATEAWLDESDKLYTDIEEREV